jgi:hypothetical protein
LDVFLFVATTEALTTESTTQAPETPNPICSEPKLSGPCRAAIPRFYFDTESGKCDTFSWGGCKPNSNNFQTLEECSYKCLGGKYMQFFFRKHCIYNFDFILIVDPQTITAVPPRTDTTVASSTDTTLEGMDIFN